MIVASVLLQYIIQPQKTGFLGFFLRTVWTSFSAWDITEKVQAPNIFPCLDSSLKGLFFMAGKDICFFNHPIKSEACNRQFSCYMETKSGEKKLNMNLIYPMSIEWLKQFSVITTYFRIHESVLPALIKSACVHSCTLLGSSTLFLFSDNLKATSTSSIILKSHWNLLT